MFNKIIEEEISACNNGFEAYDCFTGKIELIACPVGIVAADLPAKSEVTPFIGHLGKTICSRDMYNKITGEGADEERNLELLNRQREEIEEETRVTYKKGLASKIHWFSFKPRFWFYQTIMTLMIIYEITNGQSTKVCRDFL